MYDSHREMIEALRATPETLDGLLCGLDAGRVRAARGGDEGWSVVEVVCHLRDCEEIAIGRMRAMRDADNPPISGFDQEALARDRDYAADDLGAALESFRRLRATHTTELAALAPAAWDRPGRHSEMGDISIAGHTLHIVWHDAIHMAQIARNLQWAT
jgi:hypothetical protein